MLNSGKVLLKHQQIVLFLIRAVLETPDQDAVAKVGPRETIQDVKVKFAALECIEEPAQLVLSCEGMLLAHDSLVSALGSAELDLTVPLLGGKVHGSLARAGNVKGQTPKVEKKEKKKKTSRAKRRIQYNRNFANVVQAFGRRRGPNANSTVFVSRQALRTWGVAGKALPSPPCPAPHGPRQLQLRCG
ncbi:hypothetical protein pipiens_003655 [Culex pipiens pipiens]|uniref:40S ribosomal protein S30 n=1 Tax=Culex pipiens pipiens TaxID=38569 RepID=A0ABD1CUC4_CULPP